MNTLTAAYGDKLKIEEVMYVQIYYGRRSSLLFNQV